MSAIFVRDWPAASNRPASAGTVASMRNLLPSDAPYKVLFQNRGLFEETVRLVAPKLADALDFETVAALDKEHLTAAAHTRLQDKMHRVERRAGTLRNGRRPYVLALLEFQSGHDADMAWRMRDYLHLVESDLRESGTVKAEGPVPDMLSIVVHNGERPWRATAEWAPLTGDAPPARVPMYATVDLQVLAAGPDPLGRSLPAGSRLATLAGLESAPAERLPRLLLEAFRRYAGAESAGLRRGLHLRVQAALERRGAADGLPPLTECERMLAERRGKKMTAMLDATLARWSEAKVAEGVQRGLAQGVARGAAQGRLALLGRQAERRFDARVARRVTALLADVSDVSRLDEAGEWLVECDTGEALLARLRQAHAPRVRGAPS